eukprot:275608_1
MTSTVPQGRPRHGHMDAADQAAIERSERKEAYDEQQENHNWATDLFGLFERIKIDDEGMASSAFGVTITGTSYKPTGRSKIPQGVESAVHYWNRFKQFPGVTMAT